MARLRENDLRVILGPEFARIMENDVEQKAPTTPEEIRAARQRKASKLSDMRFTMFAVLVAGLGLMFGSWYRQTGFDVQAICGAVGAAFGLIALFVLTFKRRALVRGGDALVQA